MTIEYS